MVANKFRPDPTHFSIFSIRRQFVALLGTCQDCGQPVTEGQEFFRSDDGIRHALCFFDPAFAKRERELKSKTAQ
jgi:hypothetical protein